MIHSNDKIKDHVKILQDCFLFKDTPVDILRELAQNLEEQNFDKGDPIFLERETSQNVYFVKSGSVEITKNTRSLGQAIQVRVIKHREHFSELSVLTNSVHSTSAFALEETSLLVLNGSVFVDRIQNDVVLGKSLVGSLARQIQSNLRSSYAVRKFDETQLRFDNKMIKLLPASHVTKYKVIPVKLENNNLHVAMVMPPNPGFFEEFEKSQSKVNLLLSNIEEEDFERLRKPMLNNYLGFQRTIHRDLDETAPEAPSTEAEIVEYLEFSLMFSQLSKADLELIAPHLQYRRFSRDERIFSADTPCSEIYLIKSGKVDLIKKVEGHPLYCHVETRETYDSMGETCILTNTWHNLHASAVTDCEVYVLHREALEKLMNLSDFLTPLAITLAARLQSLNRLPGIELNVKDETAFTSLTEITIVRPFGEEDTSHRVKLQSSEPEHSLQEILDFAQEQRASDIHFEFLETGMRVRLRVDGVMIQPWHEISSDLGKQIVNRTKVISQMDITEKRRPQDAQFSFRSGKKPMSARVSTVPTRYGEKVVIRLLGRRSSVIPLNRLAPEKRVIKFLNNLSQFRQGLFLVAGPTGSGKTTTLYSLLSEINKLQYNIVTIEDPIELELPGINQIQINKDIDLNYDVVLKHVLRQDPDVILVGEIRDARSLQMVFDAALTGHLVLATIHASNSVDILPRLLDLGASPAQISSSLIGVMAQRLVRSICPECRTQRAITNDELRLFKDCLPELSVGPNISYGKGCHSCNYTGYFGRIPIFEYWAKSELIRVALASPDPVAELNQALRMEPFETLAEYGFRMAASGLTTIEEVLGVTYGLSQRHSNLLKIA